MIVQAHFKSKIAHIKADHADAWSLENPSAHAQLPACQSLAWGTDNCSALSRYGATATLEGMAQNAFPTVQYSLKLPWGSWSPSVAELSLLLASLLFGRAKKWGISGGERRKTRNLHFNSSLVRFCCCIVSLSLPCIFQQNISSTCGNMGKKIPYRQEMEGTGLSSLLLSRMERRPPQIPSYLIPCSTFSGTPGKNRTTIAVGGACLMLMGALSQGHCVSAFRSLTWILAKVSGQINESNLPGGDFWEVFFSNTRTLGFTSRYRFLTLIGSILSVLSHWDAVQTQLLALTCYAKASIRDVRDYSLRF